MKEKPKGPPKVLKFTDKDLGGIKPPDIRKRKHRRKEPEAPAPDT